jgi:hypothetical protein
MLEKNIKRGDTGGFTKVALGTALAGLGRYDDGIRVAQEGIAASASGPTIQLVEKPFYEEILIGIYIMAGRQTEAMQLIEDLLSRPGTLTVWKLRLDPLYDPLRNNARFQKLVAE